MNFSDFDLPDSLIKSLQKIGFVEPTPIQAQAIPLLLEGKDLIGRSETGSGKTGAFAIPLLTNLIKNPKSKGLILAPTRELANQIFDVIVPLVRHEDSISMIKLLGGMDIRRQFKQLQKKHRLIIATPGRLIDHLERNTIQIHNVDQLVLDEGDRMIDMGFLPQLKRIAEYLPKKKQTAFFTATIDEKVLSLANKYLQDPHRISIGKASRPVNNVQQSIVQLNAKEKEERILDELNTRQGSIIVFVRTQRRTSKLAQWLSGYGHSVEQIHGGRTQGQRNKAIKSFRDGESRILCATDVASRGIDVPQVQHVINFDLPSAKDDYVHRIGRTARNGATGEAVSFVTPEDTKDWQKITQSFQLHSLALQGVRRESRKSSSQEGRKKTSSQGGRKRASSEDRRRGASQEGRKRASSQEWRSGAGSQEGRKRTSSEDRRRGASQEGRKRTSSQEWRSGAGSQEGRKRTSLKRRDGVSQEGRKRTSSQDSRGGAPQEGRNRFQPRNKQSKKKSFGHRRQQAR